MSIFLVSKGQYYQEIFKFYKLKKIKIINYFIIYLFKKNILFVIHKIFIIIVKIKNSNFLK